VPEVIDGAENVSDFGPPHHELELELGLELGLALAAHVAAGVVVRLVAAGTFKQYTKGSAVEASRFLDENSNSVQ
jgi:hypothetical protein